MMATTVEPSADGKVAAAWARADWDPTSRLIITEAERRGIAVTVLSARAEYFRLSLGGRSLLCRESLSQLTHAVALSRCDDKRITSRLLREAGLRVPIQREAGRDAENLQFLSEQRSIVVKPARGEQGKGVSVGISSPSALASAVRQARAICDVVLLEELVRGHDVRVVVMGGNVVAAAVRKPPEITGDGELTVGALIERQSALRAAATSGESRIPLDDETLRCLREAGYEWSDVLPARKTIAVRKGANVHTGGTISDITEQLHPELKRVACRAAEVLEMPVVGLDMIVPSLRGADYAILEANERPGLCNHEPQPTAQRFIDLLFPETR